MDVRFHFIGLISGGKDSIFAIHELKKQGHDLVCFANLYPPNHQEIDSYMYQSAGSEAVPQICAAVGVPMYRCPISGAPNSISLSYNKTEDDEVEDLFILLQRIKTSIPRVDSVSCGAIASTYQKNRFFNVCERLGLTPLCPLWQLDQSQLLESMIHSGLEAIIIKIGCAGMKPNFLGHPINREFFGKMKEINEKFGANICGEGGEYESFVLYCPNLFKKRIKITESNVEILQPDELAPVHILRINSVNFESID